MVFVGVDWAEKHHDFCIVDEQGTILSKDRIVDGFEGIAKFHEVIATHAEEPGTPSSGSRPIFAVSGSTLWVASYQRSSIYRLDTHTGHIGGRVAWSLSLPARPLAIAVERDRLWASLDDRTIAIIDKEQRRIVDVADVKERVTKITAGGGLLWALQPSERALIAIDLVQPKVVRVIEVGRRPAEVEWVADHAWITNTRDGTVTRISPAAAR